MALLTIADTQESVEHLVQALEQLAIASRREPIGPPLTLPHWSDLKSEMVMTPRQAFLAPSRSVPFRKSAELVAAEVASPYPPGIPIITPGERITEYLKTGIDHGMYLPDVSDSSLQTVQVVS